MKKYSTLTLFITTCLLSGLSYAHPHEIGEIRTEAQLGITLLLGACSVLLTVWLAKVRKQNTKQESLKQKQDKFDQE